MGTTRGNIPQYPKYTRVLFVFHFQYYPMSCESGAQTRVVVIASSRTKPSESKNDISLMKSVTTVILVIIFPKIVYRMRNAHIASYYAE